MSCSLCDLPTPDPPVSDDAVDGTFCCRGCLEVARTLDDAGDAAADIDGPEDVRSALGDDDNGDPAPDHTDAAFVAVDGMHCATCEAFLEARASEHEGVVTAEASYPSNLVRLVYDPERLGEGDLPALLDGAGYRAHPVDADGEDDTTETIGRLVIGGFFGMMTMAWYVLFLYPTYLGVAPDDLLLDVTGVAGQYLLWNVWVMTSVVLGYTGYPILRGAYVSLRASQPNMDLLVALAAGTAYVYSTATLLLGGTEVYFDITTVVVLVVTLGGYYETRLKDRAAGQLTELTENRVATARRRTDDGEETVDIDAVAAGDELLVGADERVPVDGTVIEGTAAVFVPVVLLLALGAFAVHLALGATPSDAVLTGLAVLVVSCPCALGLATPLAVAAGVRDALDSGIVITDGDVFERATEAEVVAFDKTGTLTTGEMRLHDAVGADDAIARAAAVEAFASHPMSRAVVDGVDAPEQSVEAFERHPGRGVSGRVDDVRVTVGRADLFEDCTVPDAYRNRYERAVEAGHVPAYVGWDGAVRGVLVAGDQPRPEWERVVSAVAEEVSRVVVITGDGGDERSPSRAPQAGDGGVADRFRSHPDVDDVFTGVPPEAKAEIVERLRDDGTTVMVGDGSNDAPALAAADLGISLESGTRLAADAADAVVTTDDLTTVPRVFDLTRATKRRIRENLGWAFCYNALAVPAAAIGVLNPLVAAVAMAASSLLVVANSARGLGSSAESPATKPETDPDALAGATPTADD